MKISFDDSEFRFSHARPPRGRGSWAFGVNNPDPRPELILWATGTLTEAKSQVREQVRELRRPDVDTYDTECILFVLP